MGAARVSAGASNLGRGALAILVIGMTLIAVLGVYTARSVDLPSRNVTTTQVSTNVTTSFTSKTGTLTTTYTSAYTTTFTSGYTRTNTYTTNQTTTVTSTTTLGHVAPSISTIQIGNVSIQGYPYQVAVNPATGMLYVTDMFSNILTIINGTSNRVQAAIALLATPPV